MLYPSLCLCAIELSMKNQSLSWHWIDFQILQNMDGFSYRDYRGRQWCWVLNIFLFSPVSSAVFSIMGLVIYPVKFSSEIEMTGINMFSWAYGFGWTTAIMEICLGFFFCCLPNYEDQILGNVKPTYFYSSP